MNILNQAIHKLQVQALEKVAIPGDEEITNFDVEINEEFNIKCEEVGINNKFTYKAKMNWLIGRFANTTGFQLDDINHSIEDHNNGWKVIPADPREGELVQVLKGELK